MNNSIQQFRDAIQSNGFTPPEIIPDGKPHRFDINHKGDHKGYYQLFTDGVPFGLYGSWAEQQPGEWLKWCAKSENKMTDAERAENKLQWKKAQSERRKEIAGAHRVAAEEALRIWQASTPADANHAYLMNKKVQPHGIRQQGDDLIIPVRINEKISSIQRITPEGGKWFHSGGATAGGYYSIGKPSGRVYIVEGFATGATVHEATGGAVAIAFNAANLKPVAEAIHKKHPDFEIIITGDNDQSKVGESKGRAAADAVGGKFIMPKFTENESGSDWNDYAAIHGLDAVKTDIERQLQVVESAPEPEKPSSSGSEKIGKPSQAVSLLNIVENQRGNGLDLFHDPSGVAYATVEINGALKTLPVRGKDYRNLLRRELYQQDGRNASAQAIDDALGTIEGQALFDGAEHGVNLRVAGSVESGIWLDLGNDKWQSVRITADGWNIVSHADVKWRRPPGMRQLPVPVKGGSWRKLFEIFPQPENEQVLVIAWLLMTLNPSGPYPLLILQGEQGTGKSTLSKLLRGLIDPNAAPIRTAPRNEHDLVIAAQNGWVIALDNLSGMSPWLSDGLCRIATGGGFASRELYSNGDEHIIEATRPIIINGIDDMAARPDLADRAIILNLEHIEKSNVRTERELTAMFEAARPGIIGSLLDAVSTAMQMLPTTCLTELPRMADFALWVAAAESVLWESGTFIQTYTNARKEVIAAGLDGSPVAQAIIELMRSRESWEGTATRLLDTLPVDDKTVRLKIWPKTARGLSNVVRRLSPSLRADGLDVSFNHSGTRTIVIEKQLQENGCNSSSIASTASKPLQDKGYSMDASWTLDAKLDASGNLSSTRKPLQDKGLDATDDVDAKIRAESCSTDEPDFGDDLPPVRHVAGGLLI